MQVSILLEGPLVIEEVSTLGVGLTFAVSFFFSFGGESRI